MIKHRPKPVTNVEIDGKVYRANSQGIVELPTAYEQFNPIEAPKKKPKKEKKAKKKKK